MLLSAEHGELHMAQPVKFSSMGCEKTNLDDIVGPPGLKLYIEIGHPILSCLLPSKGG